MKTCTSTALALVGLLALPGAVMADAKEIAATVCSACHGADGNSVAPTFPKLAGLHPKYIVQQLTDYKAGKRKNDIMSPNVETLTPEDIQAMGAIFSTMKPAPGKIEDAALAAAGQKIYDDGNPATGVPACASCHKDKALGDSRYPRLAGQNQPYVIQQLMDFKSGTRTNDKGKLMQAVATRMSEDEMKAVAEYLAGQ